jgi:hypothetical protein
MVTVGNIYYAPILQWLVILALIILTWTLGSPLASTAVHRLPDLRRGNAASEGCRSMAIPAAVGDAAGFLFLAAFAFAVQMRGLVDLVVDPDRIRPLSFAAGRTAAFSVTVVGLASCLPLLALSSVDTGTDVATDCPALLPTVWTASLGAGCLLGCLVPASGGWRSELLGVLLAVVATGVVVRVGRRTVGAQSLARRR